MSKRKKAGRPAFAKEDRRTNCVSLRFTAAELATIKKAARGKPVAIYLRDLVNG